MSRRRDTTTTTTTTGAAEHPFPHNPSAASPDNPWCCPSSRTPPHRRLDTPTMDPTAAVYGGNDLFTKFNSALTAGLLNPMSPPPQAPPPRSSPTLFEMMASEPEPMQRPQNTLAQIPKPHKNLTQQRLYDLLSNKSPDSQFNDISSGDVKLTLSSKDGLSVCMSVHKHVLVTNSRFFATKLSDRISGGGPCVVEIADCDDIEVYIEALRLMYSKDLRRRLMKEDVCKVLGILKVSSAIGFNAGVLSCLEYLEAAPWAEDEEEKVSSLLSELRLENVAAKEVLKRVSNDLNVTNEYKNDNEEVLLKLLHVVLEGKDEKARREMKLLVTKMLRENSQNDLKKDSLYSACDGCLNSLRTHFLLAAEGDSKEAAKIARHANNLHWLLDILIDRRIADVFLEKWALHTDLSEAHCRVPAIHKYEISRVTARLFVGVGKGEILASKEARCLLLKTWLVPFYEDFGWMRRGTRGLDRNLIEEGLCNTILTLPLSWQQEVFMSWFDRFLNGGDDCPNLQRGFEVWWRRAFWKRNGEETERPTQLRISNDGS